MAAPTAVTKGEGAARRRVVAAEDAARWHGRRRAGWPLWASRAAAARRAEGRDSLRACCA
eukprot:gene430-67185_t